MPKFSIVIPTRSRPDTLEYALSTAIAIRHPDCEILVQQCGDDPAVNAVVDSFDDPRIRHFKTGRQVSMIENWEIGLTHVQGSWITYIGDDDGILPDACEWAEQILSSHGTEILSWRQPGYFWPGFTYRPGFSNRLSFEFSKQPRCMIKKSRNTLDRVYNVLQGYYTLPMIYNSFVSHRLIERIKRAQGQYFLGSAPDVTSGLVNCHYTNEYFFSERPLSIAGISHNSTGYRVHYSDNESIINSARSAAFDMVEIHPTMEKSRNLLLYIANEYLVVKEKLFPLDKPYLNYVRMLRNAAESINEIPEEYEIVADTIFQIARKNSIDFIPDWMPQRKSIPVPMKTGLTRYNALMTSVDLDCEILNITDIAGATRLVGTLLSPAPISGVPQHQQYTHEIPALAEHPFAIDFTDSGNSQEFLGDGWNINEPGGIWSASNSAELTILFKQQPKRPFTVIIAGHWLSHSLLPHIDITISINNKQILRTLLTANRTQTQPEIIQFEESIIVPGDIVPPDGITLWTVETTGICRPVELGISDDARVLGVGLRSITLFV